MRKLIFLLTAGIIISSIIVIFFLLQIWQSSKIPPSYPQPTPFQTNIPQPSSAPKTNPLSAFELLKELPYTSPGFTIEYLTVSEVLMITIKESPIESQKQSALNWIQDQGYNPQDFKIQYNIYPYLQ